MKSFSATVLFNSAKLKKTEFYHPAFYILGHLPEEEHFCPKLTEKFGIRLEKPNFLAPIGLLFHNLTVKYEVRHPGDNSSLNIY